jgi:chromosome segregation ATPase
MYSYKLFFGLLIISLFFSTLSGCVAKKKFLAMEDSRNRAEHRVRELSKENNALITDFENMKNEFHYNNSEKDLALDSLKKHADKLIAQLESTSENIGEQKTTFQIEKQRLNQILADKDREIFTLKNQLSSARQQQKNLQNTITDLEIKLSNTGSEQNSLKSQIIQKESEIEKLNTQIQQANNRITQLQANINKKDSELEVLNNQVKLLRKQIGIE